MELPKTRKLFGELLESLGLSVTIRPGADYGRTRIVHAEQADVEVRLPLQVATTRVSVQLLMSFEWDDTGERPAWSVNSGFEYTAGDQHGVFWSTQGEGEVTTSAELVELLRIWIVDNATVRPWWIKGAAAGLDLEAWIDRHLGKKEGVS